MEVLKLIPMDGTFSLPFLVVVTISDLSKEDTNRNGPPYFGDPKEGGFGFNNKIDKKIVGLN
ncbi:conserved hypothetical protein [Ricinus communis]|uniref:Uncharacterized protein n=1 Tax=Ricinus communis TaxID=3988 RepID=B9RPQ2_RICCO|nr:conserved hypothetical protein [Ricinus communis]